MNIKKFVIVGPESTGKSILSQNLAAYFNTLWVPEYARQYLEKNGTQYSFEDLLTIAKGQIDLEQMQETKLQKNDHNLPQILIVDTNLLVIKIWSEYVFNKCDNTILTQISHRKYDGYILCNTDLPWVKDHLREYPNLEVRQKLFSFYKEELTEQHTPWIIISGSYEERTMQAIQFIENMMKPL